MKNGIQVKSHDGVRQMPGKEFVLTNKVKIEYGKLFSKLFDWRQRGDYGDLFDFKKEDVEGLITETKEFVSFIKDLVNTD